MGPPARSSKILKLFMVVGTAVSFSTVLGNSACFCFEVVNSAILAIEGRNGNFPFPIRLDVALADFVSSVASGSSNFRSFGDALSSLFSSVGGSSAIFSIATDSYSLWKKEMMRRKEEPGFRVHGNEEESVKPNSDFMEISTTHSLKLPFYSPAIMSSSSFQS